MDLKGALLIYPKLYIHDYKNAMVLKLRHFSYKLDTEMLVQSIMLLAQGIMT